MIVLILKIDFIFWLFKDFNWAMRSIEENEQITYRHVLEDYAIQAARRNWFPYIFGRTADEWRLVLLPLLSFTTSTFYYSQELHTFFESELNGYRYTILGLKREAEKMNIDSSFPFADAYKNWRQTSMKRSNKRRVQKFLKFFQEIQQDVVRRFDQQISRFRVLRREYLVLAQAHLNNAPNVPLAKFISGAPNELYLIISRARELLKEFDANRRRLGQLLINRKAPRDWVEAVKLQNRRKLRKPPQ